jgi:gliding motility-associated-like protein
MRRILFISTFILVFINCFSQVKNLVPNPSFENYSICPYYYADYIYYATPWTQPKAISTTDFYHRCSSFPTLLQIMSDFNLPHTGYGCAGLGFNLSHNDVWREYIEVKLSEKLETGRKYCSGFYLKRRGYYAIDAVGIYFSDSFVVQLTDSIIPNIIPQVSNPAGNILYDKINWSKIKGTFIADGNEEYMTIGNFVKSQFVNGALDSGYTFGNSYYYIDDVSVCDCDDFKPKLGRDTTLCTGQQLLLKANVPKEADSVNYTWQDGSKDSVFLVTQPGTYWVSAYIEDYKITLTDTINVNYEDCNKPIWIPNSFTPNGDGLNDIFLPVTEAELENYTMLIYNRWGQQIFESHNINKGWDGKYKGKLVELGVYTYRIEATIKATKERKIFNGKVTMVCN